ncbi:glycosyltransferase family 4 protein [Salegentibacter mishustinae]|uniref:Glycosyl transferase family 1 domain-containing protein n=1 Tax=Salegentibacter mishustinae TaxID=270918 RepID=A0A0Q9Z654_9FLAO|nr:glycosyltransferase family 4 protein [Salegentibacter mishustinae]KRG28415.1 hypothetical protein APR42_06440 [Salegentibacter mishustinae]PNW22349.1 hypothetical protein APB85_14205 [Salegentibacter mishustinae]PZX67578.1 glycosyltransferase involved in cell wall biosynthesis [Salegentibacter mishustinae]GGW78816.1 hypothetical protein GCM10008086_03010 [Salegentibacter mishustinae]|tara:strand:- start:483 stop:1550 length:1068 start_codon:yes stop_codon:yes gene_type:complete
MQTVFIAFTLKNSSVAEFFVSLANKLSKTHHVIIFTYATEAHDLLLDESISILEWPSRRPTKFADFRFLVKNIREYKPKILIASFGAVNLFILAGFLMGVKHRVAWYHTLTSQLEFKRFLFWRKKNLFILVTRIIANSESAKLDVISAFNIKNNKIEVLPNAVNDPLIESETNPNKLVYAGRLHSVKGIKVLLKALGILKERYPKVFLEVIGGEDEQGLLLELNKLTAQLNLEKNIQFVGNQSKDYVLQAFSTAFCSIVPSYYEAFGYVVIESFSVQTPVIGSNTTGIAEIIEDEVSGLLFEPGNHQELASQLLRLLEQPQFRDELAEQAYKRFLGKYELNNVVDNFIEQSIIFK